MTYDKPEVRDFGSVADHTYVLPCGPDDAGFPSASGPLTKGDLVPLD